MAAKPDHVIMVDLIRGGSVPKIPRNLRVGQTVKYKSKDGKVAIGFITNGSPYLDRHGDEVKQVTSSDPPRTLRKKGTFTCSCYIFARGKKANIPWTTKSPMCGGNHVVR